MRTVIVAPDPGLALGFTTVARNVARQLRARGVEVRYVTHDGSDPASAVEAIGAFLAPTGMAAVVCVGRADPLQPLLSDLAQRPWRRRCHVTYYAAVDFAPVPASFRDFADLVDVIVPATTFGRDALAPLQPAAAIPHGVDTSTFQPACPATRATIRAELLGADDDAVVVGYVGRNVGHKRPDLALRAVAHVRHGAHVTCAACRRISADDLDPGGGVRARDTCRSCGSRRVERGRPRPVRLYLHTELAPHPGSQGWWLERLVAALGLEADVVAHDLDVAAALPTDELAARMAALDVHVLLSDCGGWELTALETAACGVPNVITDTAGPPTYLRRGAVLVAGSPVVTRLGVRVEADMDAAVPALLGLVDDAERRRALGDAARAQAQAYDWSPVGQQWHRYLAGVTGQAA